MDVMEQRILLMAISDRLFTKISDIITQVLMQYVVQRKGNYYVYEFCPWISYSEVTLSHLQFPAIWPENGDYAFTTNCPSWSSTIDSVDIMVSPLMSAIIYAETGSFSSWKAHSISSMNPGFQRPAFY